MRDDQRRVLDMLDAHPGAMSFDALAAKSGIPARRLPGFLSELEEVANRGGEVVLSVDRAKREVRYDQVRGKHAAPPRLATNVAASPQAMAALGPAPIVAGASQGHAPAPTIVDADELTQEKVRLAVEEARRRESEAREAHEAYVAGVVDAAVSAQVEQERARLRAEHEREVRALRDAQRREATMGAQLEQERARLRAEHEREVRALKEAQRREAEARVHAENESRALWDAQRREAEAREDAERARAWEARAAAEARTGEARALADRERAREVAEAEAARRRDAEKAALGYKAAAEARQRDADVLAALQKLVDRDARTKQARAVELRSREAPRPHEPTETRTRGPGSAMRSWIPAVAGLALFGLAVLAVRMGPDPTSELESPSGRPISISTPARPASPASSGSTAVSACGSGATPDAHLHASWAEYTCRARSDIGVGFAWCLPWTRYTTTRDLGCPGNERCCPPGSLGGYVTLPAELCAESHGPPLRVRADPESESTLLGEVENGARVMVAENVGEWTRLEAPLAGWTWTARLVECDTAEATETEDAPTIPWETLVGQ